MIFEAILNIFKAIAIFIINLLPAFPDLSGWVNTSLTPLFNVFFAVNYFIDIPAIAGCLLAIIAFANIDFIWAVIMWIVRKIPGVN